LFEISDNRFFVYVRQGFCQPIRGSSMFTNIRCSDLSAWPREVNAESFAVLGNGYGVVRLQKAREVFPKFSNIDFDRSHPYPS
jgi:hypothetical protein